MDLSISHFPKDSRKGIEFIVDILINETYPLLQRISNNLHNDKNNEIINEYVVQIRNIYTLCSDQIRKCFITLLEIIKLEYRLDIHLQESRQCTLERLSCCYQKLISIEELIDNSVDENEVDCFNNSLLVSPMYFVNWIDQTFEVLSKLSNIVYRPYRDNEFQNKCKFEVVECVQALHTSIDELLLSAMTLCRHCLSADQHVVKARCQVVLRETKALLSEIITGDLDSVPASLDTLKLPIMPSNVNLLIDVLKDVLYALETNTNTALLALVVHCFSQNVSPVADILRSHYQNSKGSCKCLGDNDEMDECVFVREFDLHNERILQIGSFAMSCSSDQKRILRLRSALASLEALDPHLVPAVMLSPYSHHANILTNIWRQEVLQIRDSVFLIIDPAAFADKTRQMMHQKLLEITKENKYDNNKICTVINIGSILYEFFTVYEKFEPDALISQEQLSPLLRDLNKVLVECKIVSNVLSSADDHVYEVKTTKAQISNISPEQLTKRLKLLYTLVKRINALLNPKNDEELYEEPIADVTYTMDFKSNTYNVNSPKKTNNVTRSVFARSNIKSSTGKFPLAILTKHLKTKPNKDLSFSLQLDELCNISEIKIKRETSILYTPLKNRSLRKAVLSRCTENNKTRCENIEESVKSEKESLMDDTTSLQITDVLNQINDLTHSTTTNTRHPLNSTVIIEKFENTDVRKNVLKLSVNDSKFKKVWNISVNESACTNMSQPSEVSTLERICDLDLVESKLSDLKIGHFETSL